MNLELSAANEYCNKTIDNVLVKLTSISDMFQEGGLFIRSANVDVVVKGSLKSTPRIESITIDGAKFSRVWDSNTTYTNLSQFLGEDHPDKKVEFSTNMEFSEDSV